MYFLDVGLYFSYIWGALSDSFGYKPILIISSLLLGFMSVLFGLSVNFPMAVATRFFLGLVNGKFVCGIIIFMNVFVEGIITVQAWQYLTACL